MLEPTTLNTVGNIPDVEDLTNDWWPRLERLQRRRTDIFTTSVFHVDYLGISSWDEEVVSREISSEADLNQCLLESYDNSFQIISLFQKFSLDPLQCTQDALLHVMKNWNISAMFLDVVLKFGDQQLVFEGSSGFIQATQSDDSSFELCYQLMYVEPNGRLPPKDPWSFRQTGVEHKYDGVENHNSIVALHPMLEAVSHRRLQHLVASPKHQSVTAHPLNVHLVIISSYLTHWDEYIEHLALSLQEIRNHILVIDIKESNFEAKELQQLRNIEDKILCRACRCLKSTREIVATLENINAAFLDTKSEISSHSSTVFRQLKHMRERLDVHINTAEILAHRVQATLGLLTNIIDLQNQTSSDRTSNRLLRLTRENVDDNGTVRVITVCTLIYLPASFVSSFFGMNFFDFRSDVVISFSRSFWIYVAATIPLTAVTLGAWYFFKLRHDSKRKQRQEEEEAKEGIC